MIKPAIDIRIATKDDILTLSFLHEQFESFSWGEQAFRGLFLQSGIYIWLAYIENKPVGMIIYRSILDESEILTVGVVAKYRRNNVAKELMAIAESTMANNDINKVHLEVNINNIPAQKLYQGLGYEQIGKRKKYYRTMQGLVDAITMMKQLSHC